jgi:hypothetical protein
MRKMFEIKVDQKGVRDKKDVRGLIYKKVRSGTFFV